MITIHHHLPGKWVVISTCFHTKHLRISWIISCLLLTKTGPFTSFTSIFSPFYRYWPGHPWFFPSKKLRQVSFPSRTAPFSWLTRWIRGWKSGTTRPGPRPCAATSTCSRRGNRSNLLRTRSSLGNPWFRGWEHRVPTSGNRQFLFWMVFGGFWMVLNGFGMVFDGFCFWMVFGWFLMVFGWFLMVFIVFLIAFDGFW